MFFLNSGGWSFWMPICWKTSLVLSAATFFSTNLMLIQGLWFSTMVVGSHFSKREGSRLKGWIFLCMIISFSSLYLSSNPHTLSSRLVLVSTIFSCKIRERNGSYWLLLLLWSSALISLHRVNWILVRSSAIPSGANKVNTWFDCPLFYSSSSALMQTCCNLDHYKN